MSRPLMLDTFCKAGGCSVGYHHAGFDVVGVDIEPQPNYPYPFLQMDALEALRRLQDGEGLTFSDGRTYYLAEVAAISGSPPCQIYSTGAPGRKREGHPDLLAPTRELLRASGKPYVLENVATAPMPGSILLCGATFDLPLIRHRRFEIHPDPPLLVPSMCPQGRYSRGVAHKGRYGYGHGNWGPAWREHVLPVVWPWMTLEEAGQAIPPDYTKYIGALLLEHLTGAAA